MQVFARKYRPKCLADLIGQDIVVKTVTNAFNAKKLHHAYLFVGGFGSGKTSAARILAAMENCLNTPGLNPCGKCSVCKGVFEGNHTDVEELDAAGNFAKVEQIRQLKDSAQYNTIDGAKKKYYIIDEAHAISAAGNDALLKLLEEPPPHVRFVLCTTDVQKMRPAVQSRCQRHDFKKVYWIQISEYLEKIIQAEKLTCDKSAINICAKLANGSVRSSVQNLEKLIAFAGNVPITSEHAQKMFGSVSESVFYDLLDSIIGIQDGKADATTGYRIINNIFAGGAEFEMIYQGLLDHLRCLMIGLTSTNAYEFVFVSDDDKKRLISQLKKLQDGNKLLPILDIIAKLRDSKKSVDFNITPEMALQQWYIESVFLLRK